MLKHIFKQGTNKAKPTLLLLHGTGGTEQDLLPLGDLIDPEASVLSVRGEVLENGMPRFFRRLAEGIFDEQDLVFRTEQLNAFLDEASQQYGFDRSNMVAIGYSNGANIAASLLFHFNDVLKARLFYYFTSIGLYNFTSGFLSWNQRSAKSFSNRNAYCS